MKFKKMLATVALTAFGILAFSTNSKAYTINNEFNLPAGAGSSQIAQPNLIILHETANATATGRNEATYMRNNWQNAYTTHIVGDGGIVYQVGQNGYVSWGALNANPYAPVQIELQHTTNPTVFKQNYKAYIDLARDMAKQYNIPLTLDTGSTVWDKGIKSHNWVSQNIGGDHTDPYGYLSQMGISKAQLAHDLANGVGSTSNIPEPTTPVTPPVNPTPQPSTGVGSNYKLISKYESVDVPVLNVRSAQTTNSKVIRTVTQGQVFKATAQATGESVNGFSTWFEVNGSGWVNAGLVTETKAPVVNSGFVAENATFTAGTTINVRSTPSTSGSVVAQYVAGQSVKYDGYIVSGGYVWIRYTAYSGATRYMAVRPVGGNAYGSFN